jgi:aspartate/methionine/tyrosine aminotransferase
MESAKTRDRFGMFELDEKASILQRSGRDIIYMAIGRSEETTPLHIVDAIKMALDTPELSQAVQPCGFAPLRAAIARHYSAQGPEISADSVFVGHGTSPFYLLLFSLLASSGHAALLPRPYYPLYLYSASRAGLEARFYDIDPKTFRVDVEAIERSLAAGGIQIVVVCSFGNPLGNAIAKEDYARISRLCKARGAVLWSDETYWNVDFEGSFVSAFAAGADVESTIVAAGFSKGFRMYTRRCGYCVVPQRLRTRLRTHMEHAVLTADPAVQVGAMSALENPRDPAELAALYKKRVEYCYSKLREYEGLLTKKPAGGFNIFLDCKRYIPRVAATSSELARMILETIQVATSPGEDFGVEGFIRLTTTSTRFEEGIDRLAEFFASRPAA